MELCERPCAARRLRPGDPPADRPRGLLAPALHGDGDPPARTSCGRGRGWSAPPRASWASRPRRSRPARSPSPPRQPPWRASSSPAPAPRSARPWSPRSIARTLAADGQRGRRLQARRHRPRRARRGPTTSCCAGPPARAQSDEEIAPYRYGPPASPHLAAELAGEEIDPERCCAAAPGRGGGRRRAGLRGRRRPARAARARLPGARPRRRPRAAAGDRRLAGAGHDQPHAADDRGGAERRARGRGGRAHALAADAEPRSRVQPRDDRRARRGRESRRCRARPRPPGA